ncbi:hypothetical protein GCM10009533_19340 [Saccharopolyspora spinosporotrichia]|uniref:N-acetyltransferase domain-containing protein n=1 Tax=Saccharopolyspora erythraea TaxID=1836 RepID=A0ABP3MHD6_SACER
MVSGEQVSVLSAGGTTVSYVGAGAGRVRILDAEGPGAADLVWSRLSDHTVIAPVRLGEELVARGGRPGRRAHGMRRDLRADPPPPQWADAALRRGLRLVACDRPAHQLVPAWRAAFPPGHPDAHGGTDEQVAGMIAPLLAGRVLGPLLPCSALVVDGGDRVVAGLVVNDRDGTPWVGDVFRLPEPECAGLGGLLLRRAMAELARDGHGAVGLAVTTSNPARHLYRKLGFEITDTWLTVLPAVC